MTRRNAGDYNMGIDDGMFEAIQNAHLRHNERSPGENIERDAHQTIARERQAMMGPTEFQPAQHTGGEDDAEQPEHAQVPDGPIGGDGDDDAAGLQGPDGDDERPEEQPRDGGGEQGVSGGAPDAHAAPPRVYDGGSAGHRGDGGDAGVSQRRLERSVPGPAKLDHQVLAARAAHAQSGRELAFRPGLAVADSGFKLGVEACIAHLKDVMAESVLTDQDDTAQLIKMLIVSIKGRLL